jgi:hypothetical protein
VGESRCAPVARVGALTVLSTGFRALEERARGELSLLHFAKAIPSATPAVLLALTESETVRGSRHRGLSVATSSASG